MVGETKRSGSRSRSGSGSARTGPARKGGRKGVSTRPGFSISSTGPNWVTSAARIMGMSDAEASSKSGKLALAKFNRLVTIPQSSIDLSTAASRNAVLSKFAARYAEMINRIQRINELDAFALVVQSGLNRATEIKRIKKMLAHPKTRKPRAKKATTTKRPSRSYSASSLARIAAGAARLKGKVGEFQTAAYQTQLAAKKATKKKPSGGSRRGSGSRPRVPKKPSRSYSASSLARIAAAAARLKGKSGEFQSPGYAASLAAKTAAKKAARAAAQKAKRASDKAEKKAKKETDKAAKKVKKALSEGSTAKAVAAGKALVARQRAQQVAHAAAVASKVASKAATRAASPRSSSAAVKKAAETSAAATVLNAAAATASRSTSRGGRSASRSAAASAAKATRAASIAARVSTRRSTRSGSRSNRSHVMTLRSRTKH